MPVDHKPHTVFRLDGKGCMAHLSYAPRPLTTGTAQLPSFHEVDQNRKVVDRSMRLRQEKQIVNNCAFPRAGGQFIRCIHLHSEASFFLCKLFYSPKVGQCHNVVWKRRQCLHNLSHSSPDPLLESALFTMIVASLQVI